MKQPEKPEKWGKRKKQPLKTQKLFRFGTWNLGYIN
jgi:hypothetical protein